ncbi:type I polyketide synthase [Streptomyces resistomycificus]|uniref:type I polyketide synthase n=1 Tax=Streptomyces resistomycificus TaxID=67356 RepID=UPI00286F484A|nr:SDR family NAD(P)-dependent oxidoreductase [Streptomyces resistomycificus]
MGGDPRLGDQPGRRLQRPERAIRAALTDAGLRASDVDAVEAHGTGTRLGDPMEAEALLATYGQDREAHSPLWLGSLKSNIGHTQAAAGVAAMIKMIMAMRHGVLPRTLHVDRPSTHVDWSVGAVELLTEARQWPSTPDRPRRAGVSAFGISGTNAHLILEQAPAEEETARAAADPTTAQVSTGAPRAVPWVLSARSQQALRAQALRLRDSVAADAALPLADVARSLVTTRSLFEYRQVVIGADRDTLLAALTAAAEGDENTPATVVSGLAQPGGKTVFVFPGQGSQWAGMGRELWQSSPVFAARMRQCADALAPYVDWSLFDALADAEALKRVDVVQPVLWAVMVSLAEVWRSHGVRPEAVVGHSQGEIAAACVAGALSIDDAAKVVALRSKAILALSGRGGMVSLALPADQARARLTDGLSIAAVNGPSSVVVSGEVAELDALLAACEADQVRARRIPVDYASHSAGVEAIHDELRRVLAGIQPRTAQVPFFSTVTADWLDTTRLDAEYWFTNLRHTVRFEEATRTLAEQGFRFFIEASAHPVLTPGVEQTLDSAGVEAAVVGTLRRGEDGLARWYQSAAEAFVAGAALSWPAAFADADGEGRRVDLPTYAFQRQRYWLNTPHETTTQTTSDHPLLDAVIDLPGDDGDDGHGAVAGSGRLSLERHPWLAEHVVHGAVLVPATVLAELALWAAHKAGCDVVEELTLQTPLVLSRTAEREIRVLVDGKRVVSVHSRGEGETEWTRNAVGVVGRDTPAAHAGEDLAVWPPAGAVSVPFEDEYTRLSALGISHGPLLRGLTEVWRRDDTLFAQVELPALDGADRARFHLHPALLHAALLPIGLGHFVDTSRPEGWLPSRCTGLRLHATRPTALRVRLAPAGDNTLSVTLADPSGAPVGGLTSLTLRPADVEQLTELGFDHQDSLFQVDWVPLPIPSSPATGRSAVLAGPDTSTPPLNQGQAVFANLTELAADGEEIPPLVIARIDPPVIARIDPPVTGSIAPPGTGSADRRGTGSADLPGTDGTGSADLPATVGDTLHRVLRLTRDWLGDDRFRDSRLVIVTRQATGDDPAVRTDPAAAAIWGFVRTAQTENPGRFTLVDTDDQPASLACLPAAAATGEAQLKIGAGLAPPPHRPPPPPTPPRHEPLDAAEHVPALGPGTVLITGGTSGLGAMLARHLVQRHGARRLLLTSRRGPAAPAAADLRTELTEAGAHIEVVACDVTSRDSLARLIAAIPPQHPLTAVIHCAGVLDDGIVEALTEDRVDTVLAPKVRGAWHLHELTRHLDLSAFVLFSSIASVLGTAGQANYAAANAFLNGLAQARRAQGLPAHALCWGFWAQRSEMVADINDADVVRLQRQGVLPMPSTEGLALFDAALSHHEPVLVPARLNLAPPPAGHPGSPLLRTLTAASAPSGGAAGHQEATADNLAQQLRSLAPADAQPLLLDAVRAQTATVLGHPDTRRIGPAATFKELGIDSLTALELRNKLAAVTGLKLPATLVFDHPNPTALARFLATRITPDPGAGPSAATHLAKEIEGLGARLEEAFLELATEDQATLSTLLGELQGRVRSMAGAGSPAGLVDQISSASAGELLSLLDKELG